MATETTVTNICDRCGSRHDQARYMTGNSWAQLNITWRGDKGGRSWRGDAGGVNLDGKAWLCETCTNAFLAFMTPQAVRMESALLQALSTYPAANTHQLQAAKVCAGVKALAEQLAQEG